jgi:hypothetical protein
MADFFCLRIGFSALAYRHPGGQTPTLRLCASGAGLCWCPPRHGLRPLSNGALRKCNLRNASKEPFMIRVNAAAITLCLLGALPMAASAQSTQFGPDEGEREFSISGTGSSDRNFDSGTFGVTGDLGWYLGRNMVWGFRQSINYASIEGESIEDDFWNGATRGYFNYQFLDNRARPFLGASLGGIYGDGVKDSGFAGLETGLKYYVQTKTYFLARVEYQFFFTESDEIDDAFKDDGAWAYTVGLGYNF